MTSLSFDVTAPGGLTLSDIVLTNNDVYFATDIINAAGKAGNIGADTFSHHGGGPVVPESSTWAMMLLGFAGLGLAGYRRTRTTASLA